MENSSAFIFYSNVKGLEDSTIGNTVLHEALVCRGELRAMPCRTFDVDMLGAKRLEQVA